MLVLPLLARDAVNWPITVFLFLLFAVPLFVSVSVIRRSGDTIVIDDVGIRSESRRSGAVSIPWDEVGDVAIENVMQRLVVTDTSATRRIAAEFHLNDYGILRRTVLERTGGGRAERQ